MTRVLVTGSCGFLGWHVRVRARANGVPDVVPIPRAWWQDPTRSDAALREADAVLHLAGVNRGADDDIEQGNVALARGLADALRRTGGLRTVVFANSIQAGRDSPYGRGKATAAAVLGDACRETGTTLVDMRLPNLFGEHGRPNYNSVVATFCHRLVRGETPTAQAGASVPLLHVQEAAEVLLAAIDGSTGQPLPARPVAVTDLLALLSDQWATYRRGDVPAFADDLELDLFNTLRSAAFPSLYPIHPAVSRDNRGALHECVRVHGRGGQTFVSGTHPGQVRGEHFHLRKIERFHVLRGEAEIVLRRVLTDEVVRFRVDGDRPAVVDMPTMWAHCIRNVGAGELVTLFWSDQLFDPDHPDTYAEPVLLRAAA